MLQTGEGRGLVARLRGCSACPGLCSAPGCPRCGLWVPSRAGRIPAGAQWLGGATSMTRSWWLRGIGVASKGALPATALLLASGELQQVGALLGTALGRRQPTVIALCCWETSDCQRCSAWQHPPKSHEVSSAQGMAGNGRNLPCYIQPGVSPRMSHLCSGHCLAPGDPGTGITRGGGGIVGPGGCGSSQPCGLCRRV